MAPSPRKPPVQCPECRSENLADASFCQDCGNRLELVCGGCNAVNTATSKFCRKCGTRLGAAVAAPPRVESPTADSSPRAAFEQAPERASASALARGPGPQPQVPAHLAESFRQGHAAHLSQPADERKIITALFADIKGSMALLDGIEPELAQQVIDPALRLMMNAVYRYEGYVAQALGDGIFAFFGAPIAREDHARRALYAALTMQEQMKVYGERLLREHGLPAMQIRVGIHTGEVVVRSIATDDQRADYVPIGHSTGLASRIEQVAAPGSVVVSEATHRLTVGYFEFRPLGVVPMKGVGEAVELFEVAGVGPLRTRLEVSASRGLARFVGRQPELERMQAMAALAQSGTGQIIGVIAEAGVGKSRLCHEFKLLVKDDFRVLECSSDSYGKAFPYLPLIDLLKGYLQIGPGDDNRRKLEKVTGRVLGLDRTLDDTIPFLLNLLSVVDPSAPIDKMDPQVRQRRTFDAIRRVLLREAVNHPVLVVMEDLHWLDAESQSFLTMFGHALAESRIVLLVNYRPEYTPQWDAATSHAQLRLKAFGAEDAEQMLNALLGKAPALAALKRLIVEKTEGNPFFIEEYVQTLFDQGVLVRDGDVTLMRPLSAIKMPATVQGVLAARIDRLEPDQKAFLQLLSVLGNASPLRLIEGAAQAPEAQVQEMLDRLQSAEFIYERTAFPDIEYVFKHALTRETAYGEMLTDARRRLHSRAAQAMEAHYRDRLDDHCSELAHHYACSDDVPKAVDFLTRAGSQAMRQSAYSTAVAHLGAAIALLPGLPDAATRDARELQLRSMLGSALVATRGFGVPEAAASYERARDLCRDTTDSADLVRVLSGLGVHYINRGELQRAHDLGEQLLGLAARRQENDLFVAGHELLGHTAMRIGRLAECGSHMRLAVQHNESLHDHGLRDALGRDPEVAALAFGALGLWLQGYPDRALASTAQALRAAHAAQPRHPLSTAYAMASSGWLHQFRGEASLALQHAETIEAFASEQGFPGWLVHGLAVHGWAEAELGKTDAGIARVERACSTYEATGAKVWAPLLLLLHARGLSLSGRIDEALARIDAAIAIASDMGSYWWDAELLRVRGELLLSMSPNHAEQARACFVRAFEIAQNQGAKSFELRASISLARLARLEPEGAGARSAMERLAFVFGWFKEGFDTADLIEARELLGTAG